MRTALPKAVVVPAVCTPYVLGERGVHEPFKTTAIFDAPAEHPAWLGEEPGL
jgi:hypothetical protein